MRKSLIISLCILCFILSCKEKKQRNPLTLVKYTDSTYTKKIDSLPIDSITSSITGFVKIYGYGGVNSYEKGELKQGIKTGKWYRSFHGKVITEIISYNSKGELNGEYKQFTSPEGTIMMDFNYKNNRQLGEQKEYYTNGNLALLYTKDGDEGYEGKYLALTENGDTLYYVNLGKEGNGYLKKYDRFGKLQKEGDLVNRQYQGIVKEYVYDYGVDKYVFMNVYNYQPDSTYFIKRVYLD